MNAGDTFLMPDAFGHHLYFILAILEDGSIVVCHITDARHRVEHTCVINVGEHQCVTKESAVRYDAAYICTAGENLAAFERQIRKQYEPLNNELLERIRRGALNSDNTPDNVKDILRPLIK